MKTSQLIARTSVATGLLIALAVPAAYASMDGEPGSRANTENAHRGGQPDDRPVGKPDYWGGCRGIHGDENPGRGLEHGLAGRTHDDDCDVHDHDEDEVLGSSYTMPETR